MIPKNKILWDPFYCEGRSRIYLQDLGFSMAPNVKHVDMNLTYTTESENSAPNSIAFDVLVTNPPFSQLESVVPWIVKMRKPAIFLIPEKVMTRTWFRELLTDEVFYIYFPKQRIAFIQDGVQKPWINFNCGWVFMNMNENRAKKRKFVHFEDIPIDDAFKF